MADDDGTQLVSIRHKHTQAPLEVPRLALPGYPDYELVTDDGTDGRPKRNESADTWRAYVLLHGLADEDTATDMTREQLIALVPEEN